jgi:2-isopropylmalate synthase
LAEVHVKMTVDGTQVSGRGSAQDVLEASAKAFLNTVNRVLFNTKAVAQAQAELAQA